MNADSGNLEAARLELREIILALLGGSEKLENGNVGVAGIAAALILKQQEKESRNKR